MKKIFFLLLITILVNGCTKQDFLSVTPNQSIMEPTTLKEFQAILDNDIIMNGATDRQAGVDPTFLLTGTDDYFVPDATLSGLNLAYLNMYKWSDDIYGVQINNWDKVYKGIFYANVVLDGLAKYKDFSEDKLLYDNIMGSALFFRSRFFYQLAQVYAPPYIPDGTNETPGLVLKLKADINEKLIRSSLKQSYDQIINDLLVSVKLLPAISASQYKTRPCKTAAYALLAKTFLVTGDFERSKFYADSCLHLQDTLLDYNAVSNTPNNFPVSRTKNPEIIFHCMLNNNSNIVISSFTSRIDSVLYSSYSEKDLRKSLFFRKTNGTDVFFKGSYDGGVGYFSGLAVDEIYLIRAEANIRTGFIQEGLNDLNHLMERRWKNDGSFVPYASSSRENALAFVLEERRKELINRGTRWSDVRRLNILNHNITPKRLINGALISLPPGDKRYTYLIPPDVIAFTSDMPQNLR